MGFKRSTMPGSATSCQGQMVLLDYRGGDVSYYRLDESTLGNIINQWATVDPTKLGNETV